MSLHTEHISIGGVGMAADWRSNLAHVQGFDGVDGSRLFIPYCSPYDSVI